MRVLVLAALLALPALAGCINPTDPTNPSGATSGTPYPVDGAFDTTGAWSKTLLPGAYAMLPVEVVDVPSFDGTKLNIGIFRPDVPEGTKVPVIMDAGPYYDDGDEPVSSADTHRLGGFLIEQFVPHGYAVVQASIRGTGDSTGCVDYMGEKEQRDLDALVTYLGEQEWSNGAVAMIGRSYDGSTPWEAATFGNPYLKTIVPISGITDLQQLHYRNGSSEFRSPILGALYYSYGATDAGLGGPEAGPESARMACAEGPQHAPMGAYGYATGGGMALPGPGADYWATRNFAPRVLENYEGSIFYIHGLQDWNVKPSQGVEVYNAFEGEKKALLGQWAHNYPDRPDEHENLRWDWAEMLLRWFDRELKGIPTDTGPAVEVQDTHGNWRAEPANAWPPVDATWTPLRPSADGALVAEGSEGEVALYDPAATALMGQATPLGASHAKFESAVFANDTRISGMPLFHVTVQTSTPGGNLWAELHEITADGEDVWIGRAQMDLRYAEGGAEMRPVPVGEDFVARMEFFPMDARLLAGSKLVLLVAQETGNDNLPNPASAAVTLKLGDDKTTLLLPIVERPFVESRWDVQGEVKKETA